jgi:transposase InsO family protein
LEARWVNEAPDGDNFLEYMATMSMLMDQLSRIDVKRTEMDLCLRMMTPLGKYPEGHQFRKVYDAIDNQLQDDPSKVTLAYFRRRILAATEKMQAGAKSARPSQSYVKTEPQSDVYALATLTKTMKELALAMGVNMANNINRLGHDDNASRGDKFCRFCRSTYHWIENCNHPRYDPAVHQKHKNKVGGSGAGGGARSKGREERGKSGPKRFGGREKANVVEYDSDDNEDMMKDSECYKQIGKHPSPGIDPGVAFKGGDLCEASLDPSVCPPGFCPEIKNMDIIDTVADHATLSESISECLYHAALVISDTNTESKDTIIDSGCTRTMWADEKMFSTSTNYRPCSIEVHVGDGFTITAQGVGDVKLLTADGGHIEIPNCLWVPGLKLNLISVSHLASEGLTTSFVDTGATVEKQGRVMLCADRMNNLYHVHAVPHMEEAHMMVTCDLLHQRLGHAAARRIKRLPGLVKGVDVNAVQSLPAKFYYRACALARSQRASFPRSKTITAGILDLLHMDIAGSAETQSIGGNRYVLIIADDYSRYYTSILLPTKADAYDAVVEWITRHEQRTGRKVKRVRTDGGGEFTGKSWLSYYAEQGITLEKTVPYTPEQNGNAERAVGIVKDGARTYLFQSKLPKEYGGAAATNYTYTRNMLPTVSRPDTTPHQLFLGTVPDTAHLRVFGCVAYVHSPREVRKVLGRRGRLRWSSWDMASWREARLGSFSIL